jgi:hypothetical protein
MFYELGILFSIDDLVESNYAVQAWKIFMRTCDPMNLCGSTLYEGETTETWARQENVFCIAVQTYDQEVVDYVKAAFTHSHEPALMPLGQRFLEGKATLRYPLSIRARIDEDGRFCSWRETSARQDQRLCNEAGWGFGGVARSTCTEA